MKVDHCTSRLLVICRAFGRPICPKRMLEEKGSVGFLENVKILLMNGEPLIMGGSEQAFRSLARQVILINLACN